MSQLGMGVVLSHLFGRETMDLTTLEGVRITGVRVDRDRDPERLVLSFEDGRRLEVFDDGQSCCEMRYMTVDDDELRYVVGSRFRSLEIDEYTESERDYGVHEQAFLKLKTSLGTVTIANHNEHNGYYAGFALSAEMFEKVEASDADSDSSD